MILFNWSFVKLGQIVADSSTVNIFQRSIINGDKIKVEVLLFGKAFTDVVSRLWRGSPFHRELALKLFLKPNDIMLAHQDAMILVENCWKQCMLTLVRERTEWGLKCLCKFMQNPPQWVKEKWTNFLPELCVKVVRTECIEKNSASDVFKNAHDFLMSMKPHFSLHLSSYFTLVERFFPILIDAFKEANERKKIDDPQGIPNVIEI